LYMRNVFGNILTLTTYGESHGSAIGGVIDGFPAGIDVDIDFIQTELDRRRPGQSKITTGRNEADKVEILSGIFEGKTTGCPIGFIIKNSDQHSDDYDNMRNVFRPSHADFTYEMKYGIRDHRGGGRSSARETVARCVGGAFAKLALKKYGITTNAFTSQVGDICLEKPYTFYDIAHAETNSVRCPDSKTARVMEDLIENVKAEGDTIGGIVSCVIKGCPAGLGEPAFNKLQSMLAGAMMSINAAKGFEYGEGFASACRKGSEVNDLFTNKNGKITTQTNHSGGIQGGISNGQDIYFRVAFKPVATLLREQTTVDKDGNATTLKTKGRHDPCVLPRAVPIVEAMAAMVILDAIMMDKTTS
jgi:chorismate synthase